jgi:uncharacterized protein with PIN domain
MNDKPRFISDAMLGSLTRWLRIFGFDALYFKDIEDNEIIKIAKQQQRILLTRDTRLVKTRKIGSYILINSNKTFEQLREVLLWVKAQGSSVKCEFSRCALCNGELADAEKESLANDVPEHVFLNFNSFFKCKNCGRVYWEGSHKKAMDEKIKRILKDITR